MPCPSFSISQPGLLHFQARASPFGGALVVAQNLKFSRKVPKILATLLKQDDNWNLVVGHKWSVGVVVYVLLCGYAPFKGHMQEELAQAIRLRVFTTSTGATFLTLPSMISS
jgi:serine/threonine protein kinase